MNISDEREILKTIYLGQTILLIKDQNSWRHWWYHRAFEFGDGKTYSDAEAALEAMKQIIHQVLAVKAISCLILEWYTSYKISAPELHNVQLSLLESLV